MPKVVGAIVLLHVALGESHLAGGGAVENGHVTVWYNSIYVQQRPHPKIRLGQPEQRTTKQLSQVNDPASLEKYQLREDTGTIMVPIFIRNCCISPWH